MRSITAAGTPNAIPRGDSSIFIAQDEAFLRAAAEKNPAYILSSYPDAVETLRVTLAANEACLTGKTVHLG